MKGLRQILIFAILLTEVSCDNTLNENEEYSEYNYPVGILPETPINLSDFNTKHDDFNATAPNLGRIIPFCYSTNRNSNGSEFDIIYEPMSVKFDKTTGVVTVTNGYEYWSINEDDYEIIKEGLNKIQTVGNEFGPYLIIGNNVNGINVVGYNFTLLYSSDVTGNAQIYYISNRTYDNFNEPKQVKFLNTQYDDMYPTFNSDMNRIYFCSDRKEQNFDIYYVDVYSEHGIEFLLSDTSIYSVYRSSLLSSPREDKCPFIFNNKMVFTSNREGGYGGYDLYYSLFENGRWKSPINFGPIINSEYDEYRPILINEDVSYSQTMMVFSSNRPGGKGGFDLYFVGIKNE